jgi:hypothetical protein
VKTYNKRFNAQRAARAELGDDAIEGIDFKTVKTEAGWTWEQCKSNAPDPAGSEPTEEDAEAAAAQEALHCRPPIGETVTSTTPKTGKRAAAEEAARSGVLPEPPDFSAATHARFRNKLARLVELAEAGDIEGLRAVEINPVSSSPKAMARYRDLCIIALEARK